VVCVFLGLLFPQAQVPYWLLWLFMAFCLFQFLWELILEIHQCCMYDKNKGDERTACETQASLLQRGVPGGGAISRARRHMLLLCI